MAKTKEPKNTLRDLVSKIRTASHPSQDAMRELLLVLAETVDPECAAQDGKEGK